MEEHALTTLFSGYQQQSHPPVIVLEDINHKTIGALYLERMRLEQIIVSETNNTERYFILVNGVGIYFSFWKKMSESEIINIK